MKLYLLRECTTEKMQDPQTYNAHSFLFREPGKQVTN